MKKEDKISIKPRREIMERPPMMPISPFSSPFFESLMADMDNFFRGLEYGERVPPMDFLDLGDKYEMRVEMPGISKDNIDIDVTPDGIEISAEQSDIEKDEDKDWITRESSVSFYRYIDFPEDIKTDGIDAKLKGGILTLLIPKVQPTPKLKSTKVDIK